MKFRPTLAAFGFGLVAAGATLVAHAEGNAERGQTLAYTCHGCHGVPNYNNAYPHYRVPKLGGQAAPYLVNALKAYAAGDRSHPTMAAQATTLTDQDREDIAAYLQGEVIKSPKQVVGTPPPATQTCAACHGPDGATRVAPDYPVLAGQYQDYIVQALRDYKSGKRKNPVMAGIVAGVDEKDFPAIALFFSRQDGLCSTDVIREQGKCQGGHE
jgi:cytochrome c553